MKRRSFLAVLGFAPAAAIAASKIAPVAAAPTLADDAPTIPLEFEGGKLRFSVARLTSADGRVSFDDTGLTILG